MPEIRRQTTDLGITYVVSNIHQKGSLPETALYKDGVKIMAGAGHNCHHIIGKFNDFIGKKSIFRRAA